jgi:hypothetical protein
VLSYDDWRDYYPIPYNTQILEQFGDEGPLFYYYLENTFRFNFLQFLQKERLHFHSPIKASRTYPPLVIFKNKNEVTAFVDYLCANFSEKDIKEQYARDDFKSRTKEADIQRIKLCRLVETELPKWRTPETYWTLRSSRRETKIESRVI